MSRLRKRIGSGAVLVLTATGLPGAFAAPVSAQPLSAQTITVERPPGQVVFTDVSVLHGGRLELTVTDTREDDPGWTVSLSVAAPDGEKGASWKPYVRERTSPLSDGGDTAYAQEVIPGRALSPTTGEINDAVMGFAPAGHGLGIAVLGATFVGPRPNPGHGLHSPVTVTITAV